MSNIIFRGESKDLLFNILTSAGQPANVEGSTVSFRLAENFGAAPKIVKTATLTSPISGIVNVFLSEADTAGLSAVPHIFELVVLLDGNTYVASQGTINILNSVLEH